MTNGSFKGKVAVITGSSRGIGKSIAMELAKNGCRIVLNGRDLRRLTTTGQEIAEITPEVIFICCDVSTPEGGKYLIEEAVKKFGKIDILINNVGVSMRGRMAELNPEVFNTIFASNVSGVVCPTIPALPFLRESHGSVVFISSLAGIRGLPALSAYCSSKMALRAIAESLKIEEAANQLHVGLIYVGYTENDPGKETIASDGSTRLLAPRSGKGVQTKVSVAKAVLRNIRKRKFRTVLTPIGKLNAILQALLPGLVEWIILKNLDKFEEKNQ